VSFGFGAGLAGAKWSLNILANGWRRARWISTPEEVNAADAGMQEAQKKLRDHSERALATPEDWEQHRTLAKSLSAATDEYLNLGQKLMRK
jgi:hypothetical protein